MGFDGKEQLLFTNSKPTTNNNWGFFFVTELHWKNRGWNDLIILFHMQFGLWHADINRLTTNRSSFEKWYQILGQMIHTFFFSKSWWGIGILNTHTCSTEESENITKISCSKLVISDRVCTWFSNMWTCPDSSWLISIESISIVIRLNMFGMGFLYILLAQCGNIWHNYIAIHIRVIYRIISPHSRMEFSVILLFIKAIFKLPSFIGIFKMRLENEYPLFICPSYPITSNISVRTFIARVHIKFYRIYCSFHYYGICHCKSNCTVIPPIFEFSTKATIEK